jgi:hypothetical protein
MNNYVSNELANKVHQLSIALNQAEKIINILEIENNELKKLLDSNNIDHMNIDHEESLILSY